MQIKDELLQPVLHVSKTVGLELIDWTESVQDRYFEKNELKEHWDFDLMINSVKDGCPVLESTFDMTMYVIQIINYALHARSKYSSIAMYEVVKNTKEKKTIVFLFLHQIKS